jgi:hypothetical protein
MSMTRIVPDNCDKCACDLSLILDHKVDYLPVVGDVPNCLEITRVVWTTIVVVIATPRKGEKGVQTDDEDTAQPRA